MRCKDLFKNSDIVYIPVIGKVGDQEKDIMTYCWYHGYKVKFNVGVFVDVKGENAARVLRVEKIGEGVASAKHRPINKEREAKIKKVSKMLKKGKSVAQIAKKYGVSVQTMYYFIKKWITVGKDEL